MSLQAKSRLPFFSIAYQRYSISIFQLNVQKTSLLYKGGMWARIVTSKWRSWFKPANLTIGDLDKHIVPFRYRTLSLGQEWPPRRHCSQQRDCIFGPKKFTWCFCEAITDAFFCFFSCVLLALQTWIPISSLNSKLRSASVARVSSHAISIHR